GQGVVLDDLRPGGFLDLGLRACGCGGCGVALTRRGGVGLRLGIDEGRLRLEWISAAEGARFAEVIDEFTDQVRALGPSPFASSDAIEEIEVPDIETGTETGSRMEV
ncbi:MAG: hydrogenase iron-sulfur subunit, partial [Thermoanaerobaculales bacterium]|nr:hydrogenase iron-sulfur subunit [Thermoanaerobaculales bacterium]